MLMSLSSWPTRRRPNTTGSRTAPKPFLNDFQWGLIADLFPIPQRTSRGGRPPIPPRPCLEGVLWILRTGARWQALSKLKQGPERYPSPSTCWRRLKRWSESGLFRKAWTRLLGRLDGLGGVDWEAAIADGTFAPAKKGAPRSATPRKARAPS